MRIKQTMENCSAKEYYSILFYDKRFLQINRIHISITRKWTARLYLALVKLINTCTRKPNVNRESSASLSE